MVIGYQTDAPTKYPNLPEITLTYYYAFFSEIEIMSLCSLPLTYSDTVSDFHLMAS